jgi:predicted amidohydrolase YtcJ
MPLRLLIVVCLALALISCGGKETAAPQLAANRVFLNAAVYTLDPSRSWAEAVAIKDGTIIYVGDSEGAAAYVTADTEIVELAGQMLLPGFHDAHAHVLTEVLSDDECDLLRIPTPEGVAEKLKECTELAGRGDDEWVVGGGWGEWLFPEANPKKGLLDALYPDRPVVLGSSFGHAAWVNSRALELAGITAETDAQHDGVIERDPETGEPSGTLRDSAAMLVYDIVPPPMPGTLVKRSLAGLEMLHAAGITAVIEPGLNEEAIQSVLHVADTSRFDLRARISLSPISWSPGTFDDGVFEFLENREQWRRPNVDVDSVKIYMDGVIEYGTSPLLEPYEDVDYGSGETFFFYSQEDVNRYFIEFDRMGLQVHVHAIGDAAIRRALDGFEAMREANGMSDNRHQIVHLQLIHEDDQPRFAELSVGAVFQSLWAYPDPAALELDVPMLGEERTWQMYPIASVHKAGGLIVGGSDYWVTEVEPLLAIETAVTRQDPWTNDGPVLNEDERVDLATMIEAYTINGAYQMKLDDVQGSIEVGKRADFVVLDRNLFEIPASEISDAQVVMTVFDGRTVYEQAGN